jgi:hypothetical protein
MGQDEPVAFEATKERVNRTFPDDRETASP